MFTNKYHKIWC